MWGLGPVCKTNEADVTSTNIMEEIHTNLESLITSTFYQYEKTEKIIQVQATKKMKPNFPSLSKLIHALLSVFHGFQVESSFNTKDDAKE